ncbi:hypothetical protein CFOL_v3_00269 [Cephalotus follicularis]|uniref:Uncharacterized protein n=1 Tax=Cephalotus follicularis TaxID=3775 RepID=A0A1Q3ALV6_CEPFO|nr:hypothetical protein CFOL_v3_00269 [Cephalotus follicularis]
MEAMVTYLPEQSISPYKQMKNPKRNSRSFISRPTEILAPLTNIHGGFMSLPSPSLSKYSYPLPFLLHNHHHQRLQKQQQQPPLLPLPITGPHNSLPSRGRGLSSPPTSTKPNRTRTREQSLTPKKSKKTTKTNETIATQVVSAAESLIIPSTNPLGPDPNELPKDVIKVLSSSSSIAGNDLKFSGSVFTISPHPSCLPLPKFSLNHPKLSCNAEIDAGATDSLRRILRLR